MDDFFATKDATNAKKARKVAKAAKALAEQVAEAALATKPSNFKHMPVTMETEFSVLNKTVAPVTVKPAPTKAWGKIVEPIDVSPSDIAREKKEAKRAARAAAKLLLSTSSSSDEESSDEDDGEAALSALASTKQLDAAKKARADKKATAAKKAYSDTLKATNEAYAAKKSDLNTLIKNLKFKDAAMYLARIPDYEQNPSLRKMYDSYITRAPLGQELARNIWTTEANAKKSEGTMKTELLKEVKLLKLRSKILSRGYTLCKAANCKHPTCKMFITNMAGLKPDVMCPLCEAESHKAAPIDYTALHKTSLCTNGAACQHGAKCWFAHGKEELRPKPVFDVQNTRPHKTRMCRNILNTGTCKWGAKCTFAHTEEELQKK
jgi:butyrate response factor 1